MKNSVFAEGAGYVRGRFVPIAEAMLPVTDWGFTRSDAVYDVVHVFRGGFFRLADHLDRFENSMARRRIRPPEDRAAIEAILHRCVALTGLVAFFVCRHAGALQGIPGLQRLRSLPSYLDVLFLAEPGKFVSLTVDVTSLLGWAFLANAEQQALEADYASLREMETSGGVFDIELTADTRG